MPNNQTIRSRKLEKGKVYDDYTVIAVTDIHVGAFQEKFLFNITLAHETEPNLEVQELTASHVSAFKDLKMQKVKFVCLSPGNDEKKPWIKLDDSPPATSSPERDNIFVAQEAMRLSVQLWVAGKVDKSNFMEIAEKIGKEIKRLARTL